MNIEKIVDVAWAIHQELTDNKESTQLKGGNKLNCYQALKLAAIGKIITPTRSDSTPTVKDFDSGIAQRIGNAFSVPKSVAQECLNDLVKTGLITITDDDLNAELTPKD